MLNFDIMTDHNLNSRYSVASAKGKSSIVRLKTMNILIFVLVVRTVVRRLLRMT